MQPALEAAAGVHMPLPAEAAAAPEAAAMLPPEILPLFAPAAAAAEMLFQPALGVQQLQQMVGGMGHAAAHNAAAALPIPLPAAAAADVAAAPADPGSLAAVMAASEALAAALQQGPGMMAGQPGELLAGVAAALRLEPSTALLPPGEDPAPPQQLQGHVPADVEDGACPLARIPQQLPVGVHAGLPARQALFHAPSAKLCADGHLP
jgi:hypothetical protein